MTLTLRGLSSMATKELLTELGAALRRRSQLVEFESAGGLEVARNIRAGAHADLAVLGSEQMADLDAEGHLVPGTLRPLFVSDVMAAVPERAAPIPLSSEDDLRAALIGAGRIACSTGPSGTALVELLERWNLSEIVAPKLVRAEPGKPVANLLLSGAADLGFQQRSELANVAGVRVLGALPGAAAIRSTFDGAVLARSTNKAQAQDVLRFLGSDEADELVRAAGMAPADLRDSA
jgi:molybdate transport system substrate-binding protein